MPDRNSKALSLSQVFAPPDGFAGEFGWLCGYSADAGFLNDALERFTGQTIGQRAQGGTLALVLMLDPGAPQIPCVEAPGVLHVPMRSTQKPFNLLHAKAALLGFRGLEDRGSWMLRLIVSTGNWTRQTLEDSLDLAWRVDLSSTELAVSGAGRETRFACADIAAAWSLVAWLRDHFDLRAMVAAGDKEKWFQDCISRVDTARGHAKPRFFDSRKQSLMSQLCGQVRKHAGDGSRNYVAMGSGFYEQASAGEGVPGVLARIVNGLRGAGFLTGTSVVDIFVNPNNCQAVATCLPAMSENGWSVRAAKAPLSHFGNASRTLHAKFIFSANERKNSNYCNSAWVYLGSGNLTGPGFVQKMGTAGGNLEAGVVFEPREMLWYFERGNKEVPVVTDHLPLQWDDEFDAGSKGLAPGDGMPDREIAFVSPPVAYLKWQPDADSGGWLVVPDAVDTPFELLYAETRLASTDGRFRWPGEEPRQVQLAWEHEGRQFDSLVPVLGAFGRLAATPLRPIELEEAWLQLASFPSPPDDDRDEAGPHDDVDRLTPDSGGGGSGGGSYPVRQMMQLVESIAQRQTQLSPVDWPAWCVRLEQSLVLAANSRVLGQFKEFGLNPLGALRAAPFRPEFAEDGESREGVLYEEVLRRIEEKWDVTHLPGLGQP